MGRRRGWRIEASWRTDNLIAVEEDVAILLVEEFEEVRAPCTAREHATRSSTNGQ